MPLVNSNQVAPAMLNPLGSVPLPDEPKSGPSPGFGAALGAAFRTENLIGSIVTQQRAQQGANNLPVEGYSAWEDIKGTKYEDYWSSFLESNNPDHSGAIKRQIDQEEEDRRTIAAAGWKGTIANLGAGTADPTILIPVGGEISLAGKGAWRFGRGALAGARGAGVGTAIQEAGLQETQQTRTAEESAMAIGSSIVLGGILGGSAAKLMSRPEQMAAEAALERLHEAPRVSEQAQPESAGAAAASRPTREDLTVAGRVAEKVASVTRMISPNLRANFRAAPSARQFSQELAENTLYQTMHDEGRTLGAAVETEARMVYRARLAQAVEGHNDIFSEMKKSGINMTRQDFEEGIGRAMRRGDVGDNDFISRAAKVWRETVFDPWKNEAIDHGLLPADVSVDTADSYFSRSWNRQRLTAQEPDFKAKVADYYEGRIAADYGDSVQHLNNRSAALDQEVTDLRLAPDERAKTLTDLERQGEALDTANPDAVDQVSRINELRQSMREARLAGNAPAETAARAEIEKISATGGERLRNYLKQRGQLRSRHRNVSMNYAGMQARADAVQDSLTSLQEANVRGIQRLVSRGRTLEKEAQRLDPDKLLGKLSDLRSGFYATIRRSEKAAERLGRSLDKLGVDNPKAAARIEKARNAELNRTLELNSIARRLEAAEALDPHARLDEIKGSIDDLVRQVSDVSLARGEKAQRLRERLARLDPKLIDQRVGDIAALKAKIQRDFLDRWEVKHLGEGVDPHSPDVRPNFKAHADDIASEVFDKLTGRDAGNSSSVAPDYLVPLTRGPMKDRTFNVPDQLIEEFLDDNVLQVSERYGRTMAADIELTRRFGRADMRDQVQTIRDEYRQLREAATSEADRKALADDEKGAINDLEAMRDLVRGTYKAVENSSNYGRVVRSLMAFNYLRSMGGVIISNLAEIYRPAMVHGLGRYMNQGIRPLLTNLNAIKLSVKEAKLAGQVTERVLQNRMMELGEIGDPYRSGTAVERWLTNGTRFASKWNGLVYWTDGMKAISSVLSQNRLLEAAAKGKDKRLLAYLGIDEDLAGRIGKEFAEHGDVQDGVSIANTQHWVDDDAVRAFRAAVSKDVDSMIVTKSVGDVPLFANTATGKLILQFRNYNFSAHQRVTLRALQEGKAQFMSGLIGITSLGMMGAVLRSWRGGDQRWEKFKDAASNPGYLIGEGIDLGGMFPMLTEIGNDTEKLTQPTGFSFNPVKTPIMAAGKAVNPNASMQGSSVRFSSRDPIAAILGPTAGLPSTVAQAVGAGGAWSTGGQPAQSQATAATSLVPFGSYVGMKEAIQVLSGDSPYVAQHPK